MAEELPEEHHRKHSRTFWSFWGHGFKKAFKKSWEKYGHALIVFGLLYAIAAIGLPKWIEAKLWGLDMSLWVQLIIPSALLVAFLIYHIFRAPYEIYKEQFEKHQAELAELEKKFLNDVEKMNANNAKLAEILSSNQSKLIEAENKLSERSKADKLVMEKQLAKQCFGNYLIRLQNRLYEARQLSRYDFVEELRKKEWESTNELFNKIDNHLAELLTSAEVAIFRDARPSPLSDPTSYDMFTERFQEWQWHVNFITARKEGLKSILERLV